MVATDAGGTVEFLRDEMREVVMTVLFDSLFDDAALFPPGNSAMAEALPAHRELRSTLDGLVGPLVVPAARLAELVQELDEPTVDHPVLELSVIVRSPDLAAVVAAVGRDARLRLHAVEIPEVHDRDSARRAVLALGRDVPPGVRASVEVPRSPSGPHVLDELAATPHQAKLRTGGLRAELFPDATELAATIVMCAARRVPFKCTAGLHSALRHVDPLTGFEHHGFLNLLVAAAAAVDGATLADVADVLARQDRAGLAGEIRRWTAGHAERARSLFTSFGTCSVREPADQLLDLGLLPERLRLQVHR